MRVLVVEDEPDVGSLLRKALRREGYSVDVVDSGAAALAAASANDYDAIVLDILIPAPDGFEVCRRLRDAGRWAPILVVSVRGSEEDRIRGLDAGADDYLAKPFSVGELLARLRALIRRGAPARPAVLTVGDISLDPATREVRVAGTRVDLTRKEFSLLELFLRNPERVLTRDFILDHAWGGDYDGASNVVDVYVRYLRNKVCRPFGRSSIESVRGVGYRFCPEESDGELPA